MSCKESDDPWPLSPEVNAFFSSRRNFFTGTVKLARSSQAGDLGPFYSAAMFPQGERGFWIVAFTTRRRPADQRPGPGGDCIQRLGQ